MSYYSRSPFDGLTPVVKNLLILNFIFFGATFLLARANIDLVRLFSVYYFDSPGFRPWQIITYMFMHNPRSFGHILGNMLPLFFFGPMLERTMGSKRFFNFYFICGLGALFCNVFIQALEIRSFMGSFVVSDWAAIAGSPLFAKLQIVYLSPMLGASGAIFGILAGILMLYPNLEVTEMFIPIPIKAKYIVICYMAVEVFAIIKITPGDPIAHYAHIGGALFGFLMVKIWGLQNRDNHYY